MSMFRRWGQPWSSRSAYVINHAHINVITPPQIEPVNITDVRKFTRINFTTDDQILLPMIKAARQRIEGYLRRALITQTVELILDWGPAWIELPRPPLQSVTSIQCMGLNNELVTADPASYYVVTGARLVGLNPSSVWPVHITPAGWRCTFVAGYGDDPSTVPEEIKLAIWNVVAGMYDNRGTLDALVGAQQTMLRPFRIEGQPFRFAKGVEPPELLA